MSEERRVLKSTFEDCLDSQERLRAIITQLAQENRCLNVDEQGEFFRELAHATYGLGREKRFNIFIDGVVNMSNVEAASRYIATRTSNKVCIPGEYGNDTSPPVDISILWDRLLLLLYDVFPAALDRSSAMSKERDASSGGESYSFKPPE